MVNDASPRMDQPVRAPAEGAAENPSKATSKSSKREENQRAALRRKSADGSRKRQQALVAQQDVVDMFVQLTREGFIIETEFKNGMLTSLASKGRQNLQGPPPGLTTPHPRNAGAYTWRKPSATPRATVHVASNAAPVLGGASSDKCEQLTTCATACPPPLGAAQGVSGDGSSTILSPAEEMRSKVETVMEAVGVSSPVANAALVAEDGDVNNASISLLKAQENSDPRDSVQRMKAGIEEEAANVVKKGVGGPGTSPPVPEEGSSVPSTEGASTKSTSNKSRKKKMTKGGT